MRFREMLYRFFAGRNGGDALGNTLFVVYFLIAIINRFARSAFLSLLMTVLLFYILFRMLSRNIYARQRENAAFLRVFGAPIRAIKNRGKELKDSTHIYKTCPACRSRLRLARRKGSNKARCPRCQAEFKVFSLFS